MDNLFDSWKVKVPSYSSKFKGLFNSFSHKGGAEGEKKINFGKNFSTNYELYIYAFFLGLYTDTKVSTNKDEKKVNFSHAIQNWGSKSRMDRKDFTNLQEYIFMALVAKSNIDILELDKGNLSIENAVKLLLISLEQYTNGGLTIIVEKNEDNINPFIQSDSFLRLMIESNK